MKQWSKNDAPPKLEESVDKLAQAINLLSERLSLLIEEQSIKEKSEKHNVLHSEGLEKDPTPDCVWSNPPVGVDFIEVGAVYWVVEIMSHAAYVSRVELRNSDLMLYDIGCLVAQELVFYTKEDAQKRADQINTCMKTLRDKHKNQLVR